MPEHYIFEIMKLAQEARYIVIAKRISEFVQDIYRSIEPSHFNGKIIVFYDFTNSANILSTTGERFYDKAILNNSYDSLIFQIKEAEDDLPLIWSNVNNAEIDNVLNIPNNFIAYVFENKSEYFIVNNQKVNIRNTYSCPSIFALQYHDLNEALLDYKNSRVRTASCELFKECWADENRIYLKNKPEECMQISLKEFLQTRIRGVNVVREYTLGASKPVDIRVFWREANRAALIELKWMGQSLTTDDSIGTSYSNVRANDGMQQIKEYIDLNDTDSPEIITKGYLAVIDARRRNINTTKILTISRSNGFFYQNTDLSIDEDKQYWISFPNIEKPINMFIEPICEI